MDKKSNRVDKKSNRVKILGMYKNGNYSVMILEDGTKIRRTEEKEFIPSFAENCDVKITDKCSKGCPFCYEGCTPKGDHGQLLGWKWVESLHPHTELALNGNDMDHPQLYEFLNLLKSHKIIANITVQEQQFTNNSTTLKHWQDDGLIHGIGVSLTSDFGSHSHAIFDARDLKNVVFHTIAGVTGEKDYRELMEERAKVLILGYKNLGRGIEYKKNHEDVEAKMSWLKDNMKELWEKCSVVSFDNLSLEQLDIRSMLTDKQWETFYMGDDGQYTFYMDLVKGVYAKNSLDQRRFPIGDKTIDEMFAHVRTIK